MWQKVKTKSKNVLGLIPTLVEVTRENLVWGAFCPPPPSSILTRVNDTAISTSFVLPVSEGLTVILELNLNDSESIML